MTDLAIDLFGPPPLMRGEDPARYNRLYAAVEHQIQPKDFFDRCLVRELTDKHWEQQRCKSGAAALIEGAYIEALANLVRPFLPDMGESADKLARDYYGGDASGERMAELETLLAQYGVTPEQIRAKAMQLCGTGVLMLNRMATSCETSLRILRKDHVRRSAGNDNAAAADEAEIQRRRKNGD